MGVGSPFLPPPLPPSVQPRRGRGRLVFIGEVQYRDLIEQAAKKYGLDPSILAGLIQFESGGNPSAVNKDSGATGLGQVMPREAGFSGRPSRQELLDPATNIEWSARILADGIKRYGTVEQGLAAYLGAIDPKTGRITGAADANGTTGPAYIKQVLSHAKQFAGGTFPRTGDPTLVSSATTQEYERQKTATEKRLADNQKAKGAFEQVISAYAQLPDNHPALASGALKNAKEQVVRYQKLIDDDTKALEKLGIDAAKAQDDDNKPKAGSIKEQGSKLWFFPSDGGPGRDVTPDGWEPDTEKPQTLTFGNAVYERQSDGTWKPVLSRSPGADRTPEQQRTEAANATTAEANATTAARRAQPGGYGERADAAGLTGAEAGAEKAKVDLTTAQRRSRPGGYDEQVEDLNLRTGRARADDEELKVSRQKRMQDLADQVARGVLDPKQALLKMGEFDKFLTAQLQERRQRFDEQTKLAKLADETEADAVGSAVFFNRGQENQASRQAALGRLDALPGAPGEGIGQKLLRRMGFNLDQYKDEGAQPAPQPPPPVQPQATPSAQPAPFVPPAFPDNEVDQQRVNSFRPFVPRAF